MMTPELQFEVPKHLFPFEHRFIDLGANLNIHYVDEGQGECLLMLHGNPTWCFLYRKMITKLRHDFRCIAMDYPGFGLSGVPEGYGFSPREHSQVVEQFVDALGLKELTIIGQDWGGPIGLGFAGRRPEIVKRIVAGNTWAWPLVGNRGIQAFSWLMGGPIGRMLAYGFNGVVRFFLWRGFVHRPEPEVLRMYHAPFRLRRNRKQTSIFPRELTRAVEYLREVEQGLSKIADRPALFVWGARDFAFRQPELERFEALFPNHHTVVLEAGHFWQEDAADKACEAIKEWRSR